MASTSQVALAIVAGLLLAPVTFALYHAARTAFIDGSEALLTAIDDALAAPLPDFLLDED